MLGLSGIPVLYQEYSLVKAIFGLKEAGRNSCKIEGVECAIWRAKSRAEKFGDKTEKGCSS